MKRVLEDIRILDFGRFIACPYCGMNIQYLPRTESQGVRVLQDGLDSPAMQPVMSTVAK